MEDIESLDHVLLLKIGINNNNKEKGRDQVYRTENPTIIYLRKFLEGGREDELRLKRYLRPFKFPLGEEWYYLTDEIKTFIDSCKTIEDLRRITEGDRVIEVTEKVLEEIRKRRERNKERNREYPTYSIDHLCRLPILSLTRDKREYRCIKKYSELLGLKTVGDYLTKSDESLLEIRGIGTQILRSIKFAAHHPTPYHITDKPVKIVAGRYVNNLSKEEELAFCKEISKYVDKYKMYKEEM